MLALVTLALTVAACGDSGGGSSARRPATDAIPPVEEPRARGPKPDNGEALEVAPPGGRPRASGQPLDQAARRRRLRRQLLNDPEKLEALRRRVLPGNIAPAPKVNAADLQRYLEARPKVLPGQTAPAPEPVDEKRYRELRKQALGG